MREGGRNVLSRRGTELTLTNFPNWNTTEMGGREAVDHFRGEIFTAERRSGQRIFSWPGRESVCVYVLHVSDSNYQSNSSDNLV